MLLVLFLVLATGCISSGAPPVAPSTSPAPTPTPTPTMTPTATATPPTETGTASPIATPRESTPTATATPAATVEFAFAAEGVRNCGLTCRELTGTLTNTGSASATGVEVRIRITAGEAEIFTDTRTVGQLAAGESVTLTRTVTIGLDDYVAVRDNGGVVEIERTVTWDGGSQTFTGSQQVL